MDMKLKTRFMERWKDFFPGADLPLVFFYTNDEGRGEHVNTPSGRTCFIAQLMKARNGEVLQFSKDSIVCSGGKRYLGFSDALMPGFEYFLSCGIPGKLEGERYKKSPEIVKELVKITPHFSAPAKTIVFKRWDRLEQPDTPEVAIFFVRSDELAGLFGLANYEWSDPNGVFAPMSAGCGSIVQYPYLESLSSRPRGVIGMFDPSARPHIEPERLSFAVPMSLMTTMINNMEESFLITPTWTVIQKRMISPDN
jgi:uncharacterized protein (DUF169 family)